jgi:hypothetical protein
MQSNSVVIDASTGDKKIINELFGGLSLAPYGIFLLLSAYAFAQGWLNWETNGGPPYLGGIFAWLMDKLIRRFYRKKYNFAFGIDPSDKKDKTLTKTGLFLLLSFVVLLIFWYVDATFHFNIRFMPLWFGLFVCLRGIDWLKKGWARYGLTHVLSGIFPICMSVLPFILGVSSNNQYFGVEGIYELTTMGVVILIISILEHLIFLNVRNSDFE